MDAPSEEQNFRTDSFPLNVRFTEDWGWILTGDTCREPAHPRASALAACIGPLALLGGGPQAPRSWHGARHGRHFQNCKSATPKETQFLAIWACLKFTPLFRLTAEWKDALFSGMAGVSVRCFIKHLLSFHFSFSFLSVLCFVFHFQRQHVTCWEVFPVL